MTRRVGTHRTKIAQTKMITIRLSLRDLKLRVLCSWLHVDRSMYGGGASKMLWMFSSRIYIPLYSRIGFEYLVGNWSPLPSQFVSPSRLRQGCSNFLFWSRQKRSGVSCSYFDDSNIFLSIPPRWLEFDRKSRHPVDRPSRIVEFRVSIWSHECWGGQRLAGNSSDDNRLTCTGQPELRAGRRRRPVHTSTFCSSVSAVLEWEKEKIGR